MISISDSEYPKSAVEWKSLEKRRRRYPKKRWVDGIKQDLEKLAILNWEEKVQNRRGRKEVSVGHKLIKSYDARRKKKKRNQRFQPKYTYKSSKRKKRKKIYKYITVQKMALKGVYRE